MRKSTYIAAGSIGRVISDRLIKFVAENSIIFYGAAALGLFIGFLMYILPDDESKQKGRKQVYAVIGVSIVAGLIVTIAKSLYNGV